MSQLTFDAELSIPLAKKISVRAQGKNEGGYQPSDGLDVTPYPALDRYTLMVLRTPPPDASSRRNQ
jgi:hypothetical protein